MFHSRMKSNNRNHLHERFLCVIYNVSSSSFEKLLTGLSRYSTEIFRYSQLRRIRCITIKLRQILLRFLVNEIAAYCVFNRSIYNGPESLLFKETAQKCDDDLVFFRPGINTEILINIIMYLLCILI